MGVIIMSNLNRVRLSCCWVGVGLGGDSKFGGKYYEQQEGGPIGARLTMCAAGEDAVGRGIL